MNSAEEIRCEIIPIPTSSPSDVPTHTLFFHRFDKQGAESAPRTGTATSSCPLHHSNVATVQCIYCVENGSAEKQRYNWSNRSSHDTINRSFKLVSWFDERIEVVLPKGRNWINRLGSSDIFVTLADNVGFSFKLGPASVDNLQDALYAKDVRVAEPGIQRLNLSPRCQIPVTDLNKSDNFSFTKEFSEFGNLSVLTYNILSDIYLYPDKYFFCPQWALKWEYRRNNLLHEIILYDADIVCLQEVQSDHYENFFKPELEKHGYLAVYKKKTKEVYTGNGYTIDGCATFFRGGNFKEIISYGLEFSNTPLPLINKLEPSQRDQAGVRLIKDNIALIVILEMVGNASSQAPSWSKICVVNTHIFASKGSPDVKLLQVSDLIREIEKMSVIDPRMPLFLCGDINSVPGSDPYTLLVKGEVKAARGDEARDPLCIHPHLKLRHSMNLASAYTPVVKSTKNRQKQSTHMRDLSTGELVFPSLKPQAFVKPINDIKRRSSDMSDLTAAEFSFPSFTPHRQRTLDYIFYTVDNLEVKGLLELPDPDSLCRGIPSPLFSSDHIALMAKFRVTRPFLG